MAEPLKVLVVDDHKMFADGIQGLLSSEKNIQVIGQAHTGAEALRMLAEHQPEVMLLDISLPDMDGIEVCRQAGTMRVDCAIIALSMHEESAFITSMMEQGAKGYLLKSADRSELLAAIQAVHGGAYYYSRQVAHLLLDEMMHPPSSAPSKEKTSPIELSDREKDVLDLIVKEFTTQEIAERLFLSPNTVETHRRRLLEKMGARNTAGLVRIAFEQGLL